MRQIIDFTFHSPAEKAEAQAIWQRLEETRNIPILRELVNGFSVTPTTYPPSSECILAIALFLEALSRIHCPNIMKSYWEPIQ